jgi:opacity protein-like surface antigen
VKQIAFTLFALGAVAGAAHAQDLEPVSFYIPLDSDPADPAQIEQGPQFYLGLRAGYLRAKEADEGTWHGGLQARLFLIEYLAVEGSIEFHQSDFEDGNAIVTQYPVQVSALLFPFPQWKLRPYGLAGVGWYYTHIEFTDALNFLEDETTYVVGLHVGAGADLKLGNRMTASADVRYIWQDDADFGDIEVDGDDISYWQLTFSLNFGF